jgi:hypothetical protein
LVEERFFDVGHEGFPLARAISFLAASWSITRHSWMTSRRALMSSLRRSPRFSRDSQSFLVALEEPQYQPQLACQEP